MILAPLEVAKAEYNISYSLIAQAIASVQHRLAEGDALESLASLEDRLLPEMLLPKPHLEDFFYQKEALNEAFLQFQNLYGTPVVDYEKLWYGDKPRVQKEEVQDEYGSAANTADTKSEILTTREAEELFMKFQYAALVGAWSEVTPEERRRFNLSIIFDHVFFQLFESLYSLTREVNYGSLA